MFLCSFDCTIVSIKGEVHWDFKTITCSSFNSLSDDCTLSRDVEDFTERDMANDTSFELHCRGKLPLHSAEPPIGVRKALKFMDQVQGLASSIGNSDMLSAVADATTLLEQHTIKHSKQTDIQHSKHSKQTDIQHSKHSKQTDIQHSKHSKQTDTRHFFKSMIEL